MWKLTREAATDEELIKKLEEENRALKKKEVEQNIEVSHYKGYFADATGFLGVITQAVGSMNSRIELAAANAPPKENPPRGWKPSQGGKNREYYTQALPEQEKINDLSQTFNVDDLLASSQQKRQPSSDKKEVKFCSFVPVIGQKVIET